MTVNDRLNVQPRTGRKSYIPLVQRYETVLKVIELLINGVLVEEFVYVELFYLFLSKNTIKYIVTVFKQDQGTASSVDNLSARKQTDRQTKRHRLSTTKSSSRQTIEWQGCKRGQSECEKETQVVISYKNTSELVMNDSIWVYSKASKIKVIQIQA